LLPLTPGGEFAKGLASGRAAAMELYRRLSHDDRFQTPSDSAPDLDIVVWKLKAENRELASALAHRAFAASAARDLHLALVELPLAWFRPADREPNRFDAEKVTCLRSVLMKPEHEAWLDSIWDRLSAACQDISGD